MPYISLDNLTRYDEKIKQYAKDGFAPADAMNWQKTESATTATCYPVPETELEPVVDFLFAETPPASGVKGPDNPSTITGVSSITVTHCETVGEDETDYTIALGDTYYGGSLDVATGTMTVTHVAVEPDASTVDISSAPAKLPLSYTDTFGRTITSTDGTSLSVGSSGGAVVYEIATHQTVQLTPTQIYSLAQADEYTPRLNTIYTDQQSVQVGYAKSPIYTESELTNAIFSLGGNV